VSGPERNSGQVGAHSTQVPPKPEQVNTIMSTCRTVPTRRQASSADTATTALSTTPHHTPLPTPKTKTDRCLPLPLSLTLPEDGFNCIIIHDQLRQTAPMLLSQKRGAYYY
jgi:hypothetical protein